MTRKRPLQFALAGLLLAALHAEARAATEPSLPSAIEGSVLLHGRAHVALVLDADETGPGLAARTEVEQALKETGHEVIILPARRTPLPPERELLDAMARAGAAALVLVQSVPAYGPGAVWVSAYDLEGDRLFGYGGHILAPVVPLETTSIDLRDLLVLDGPELYRTLGRPDLAARYERRRTTKTVLRVTGGILLGVGVLVGILDVLAVSLDGGVQAISCLSTGGTSPTNPSCQNPPQASGIPWLVALGGLGMLVAPSFVSTDPLTPAEKRALIDSATGAPPRAPLSFSIAPAFTIGGGEVVLGGRF